MVETIRACHREDIPHIADMFARVLLKQKRAAGADLRSYLERLVFETENADDSLRSRVFVDQSRRIIGFIGILPQRMQFAGKPILAAAAGSLMVETPKEHPTAGARLMRAFLSGPQDLSFSETANEVSQRMWLSAGGERLASASLDWLRVLRPTGLAVRLAERSVPLMSYIRPIAAAADAALERLERNPFLPVRSHQTYRDADIGTVEIAKLIPKFCSGYVLHPAWDEARLSIRLSHAKSKERYGTLYRRIVYAPDGRANGCYLYYGRPGGIAWVLQVLADQKFAGETLDSLIHHAAEVGCVGVRGRVHPDLLDSLIARRCVLFHVSATMVHSRNKVMLSQILQSRVLLNGLAGEGWTRLIGGEFG